MDDSSMMETTGVEIVLPIESLNALVLENLREVMGGDYPLLLETFLVDSDDRLQALRAAVPRADTQAMRLAAHSFKGSCSNMGALLLASHCKELEEFARKDCLQAAIDSLQEVELEFAIVRALFQAELQRYR
jgi:HPt (histidine-containing phosphotransfer) domain-containing protein